MYEFAIWFSQQSHRDHTSSAGKCSSTGFRLVQPDRSNKDGYHDAGGVADTKTEGVLPLEKKLPLD